MRRYVRTGAGGGEPHALCLPVDGLPYVASIQHATLDEIAVNDGRRISREHSHDVYHAVLYEEGSEDISIGGRVFPVGTGTLALTAPGEAHHFSPRRKGSMRYHEVTFVLEDANGRALTLAWEEVLTLYSGVRLSLPPAPLELGAQSGAGMASIYKELMDWLETPGVLSMLMAQQALARMLAFIIGVAARASAVPESRIVRAMEHVRSRFRERVTIERLASLSGMSRAHFIRTFKKKYGDTPVSLQHKLRIEAAKTLLASTELACGEIASLVGYSDPWHFSKMFKKCAGFPPSEVRARRGTGRQA